MIGSLVIARGFWKWLLIFSIVFIAISIYINTTLERNPFIFPILQNGQVTFLTDGYITIYSDDSWAFQSDIHKDSECIWCWETRNIPVKKWQTTKVIWINIWHADMGTSVGLITELWPISSFNIRWYWDGKIDVTLNKAYKNEFVEYISILMMYPTLPIMIPVLFWQIL
jgi:hypothetical protein